MSLSLSPPSLPPPPPPTHTHPLPLSQTHSRGAAVLLVREAAGHASKGAGVRPAHINKVTPTTSRSHKATSTKAALSACGSTTRVACPPRRQRSLSCALSAYLCLSLPL